MYLRQARADAPKRAEGVRDFSDSTGEARRFVCCRSVRRRAIVAEVRPKERLKVSLRTLITRWVSGSRSSEGSCRSLLPGLRADRRLLPRRQRGGHHAGDPRLERPLRPSTPGSDPESSDRDKSLRVCVAKIPRGLLPVGSTGVMELQGPHAKFAEFF